MAQSIKAAVPTVSGLQLLGHAGSAGEAMAKLPALVDIIILQIRLPDADGFNLISQIRQRHPSVYFVPALQGNEAGDVWQKILQNNMRDVLVPPFTPQAIASVLHQASINAQHASPVLEISSSYMVAVASARSGVGKSIFAVNLALAMARQKVKPTLLDYSMSPGDFFTMLDQVPRNTIVEAISQGLSLDVTLLRNLVADHKLGFQFLACPNDDFDFYGFDAGQASNLLKELRSMAEYIVVDTGAYDLPPTHAAVEEADLVYLITTRDLSRLMSLQRWMKSLESRGVERNKFKVIVNNAEVGTEISEEEIEEVLSHPVTAYLPSCPAETVYSINSGKLFVDTRKDHPFTSVIEKLAEFTIQRWAE
ncbi:MAG: response regulator/pilus assembly protein [Blastochloris sp.]|nr:response regulator/pilus assembly protein [Blastochloris sp.]